MHNIQLEVAGCFIRVSDNSFLRVSQFFKASTVLVVYPEVFLQYTASRSYNSAPIILKIYLNTER